MMPCLIQGAHMEVYILALLRRETATSKGLCVSKTIDPQDLRAEGKCDVVRGTSRARERTTEK